MGAAITPYRPILLCAWQQHRNLGSRWLLPVLALLCLGALLTLGLAVDWRAALIAGQATSLLVLLALWGLLFSNLRRQNHPASAHLVPQHLQRLRATAVAVLLTFTALGSLILSLSTGQPLAWALGLACLMLAIAACLRWPRLWFLIWLLPTPYWLWPRSAVWPWLKQGLLSWYTQQPASLAAAALILLPWLLSRMLQGGGNSHIKNYQVQDKLRRAMQEQMRGGMVTPKALPPGGFWLMRLFSWPRPLWTAYLLSRANVGTRSMMARLDLVTLGNVHWASALGAFSIIFGVAAAIIGITQALYGYDWRLFFGHSNAGLHVGIISMAISPLFGLAGSLYGSRREQALLMLLPHMPRGKALNAAMSRRLLIQFGLQWLIALALIQGVLRATPADFAGHFSGLHILLVVLPMGSLLLRNWARQAQPSGNWAALAFIATGVCSGAIAGLQGWLELSLWPFAIASVLLTLGLVYARWQRWVLGGPQAMPVGRLTS